MRKERRCIPFLLTSFVKAAFLSWKDFGRCRILRAAAIEMQLRDGGFQARIHRYKLQPSQNLKTNKSFRYQCFVK